MISAQEARKISDDNNFANSEYVKLADEIIRDKASKGFRNAVMIIPNANGTDCRHIASQLYKFLQQNGYTVGAEEIIPGVQIAVSW